MNLSESLVLLAASVVLLYFGRGRGGDSHPQSWLKLAEQAVRNSETALVYETPPPKEMP